MDYKVFLNGIDDIYAIFGKKIPEDRVILKAYERIKDTPNAFMDYIVKHFENQESLPKNMGYYLNQILWPEFLNKHPEYKQMQKWECCSLCEKGMPGLRRVWKEEITLTGKKILNTYIIPCICGNKPNNTNEPILNDSQLIELGYILECPYHYDEKDLPPAWRKTIGVEFDIRPEHKTYMEEYERYEF